MWQNLGDLDTARAEVLRMSYHREYCVLNFSWKSDHANATDLISIDANQ